MFRRALSVSIGGLRAASRKVLRKDTTQLLEPERSLVPLRYMLETKLNTFCKIFDTVEQELEGHEQKNPRKDSRDQPIS